MAEEKATTKGSILVIGGGISGMTTALEAAEVGHKVIILEKEPYLGGMVTRIYKYFPKLCPPNCGLEINLRRLKLNTHIEYYTQAEVTEITGSEGSYTVSATMKPRFVNQRCTMCGDCIPVCPVERDNTFNYGLDKTKAVYYPFGMAFPAKYVIDGDVCQGESCNKCVEVCKYQAIDLDMKEEKISFTVNSVVLATGWKPYDATKIDNLGFGKCANVITNVIMERYAASNGPTQGKIIRPSDGKEIKKIAFAQCAGSRDENHLPYCSVVCCLASLKHANYVRELYPDAEITMYYIDIRTPGRLEDFLNKIDADPKFHLVKGKVAKVEENPATKNVMIEVEDTLAGKKIKDEFDMLVLATGMQPNDIPASLTNFFVTDEYGFVAPEKMPNGIFGCGVAKKPVDVSFAIQDATGIALKAIQQTVGR